MKDTTRAHVESVISAIREWQRGAITWKEMLRRADVTAKGEARLFAELTSRSPENVIRFAASRAVAGR